MKTLALGLVIAALATGAFAADNTLTADEKAAGWTLLFDGKSTDGWRGFKRPGPAPGWRAEGGVLTLDPKVARDIMTKDQFGSFELSFEWRIGAKGNSGVMFHVIEVGDQTYESGPEYQVLDNSRGEPPLEQAGALYALYPPVQDATKPVGQFNQARLIVNHGKVQHWLNGVKVAEYDMGSEDFKAKVAASKFKRWPQFASSPTGHIALQNHGDDVAYRNLKIRPLP